MLFKQEMFLPHLCLYLLHGWAVNFEHLILQLKQQTLRGFVDTTLNAAHLHMEVETYILS